MIVKINSNEVTVQQNDEFEKPSFGRNSKEEREMGFIVVISDRKKRYEVNDIVDITDPNEQYLVQSDVVDELNGEYIHSLTLIENMAKFDTIYPADRSNDLLNQTLEGVLTKYKRELSAYHQITITWDLSTESLNTTIPTNKPFTGLNFSQILQSLFRSIWAIPKVTRDGNNWEIYAQYFNEKNNLITNDFKSSTYQQNNLDYATRIKSQLKNVVNENKASWFPSETGYIYPRSSNFELAPSKLRYELDSPIVSIIKAEVVDISFNIKNIDTDDVEPYTSQTIDITNQIVQQDIFDLLPTALDISSGNLQESDNNRNALIYNVGDRYITNLYESSSDNFLFNGETKYLFNAIKRAIYVEYNDTGNYENAVITSPTNTADHVKDIKLRVQYIKQRDMDFVHSRKTKGVMNYSTFLSNQRDSAVEAGQYLKVMRNYSNRLGNNVYVKSKIFSIGNEYGVFDYTEDYNVVTNVKNTYLSSTQVLCEWEESENFANIEAEYALKKVTDPYVISKKAVTTNLVAEEYIEFSETNRGDDTKLTTIGKRLVNGLLESGTISYNPIQCGVFKPVLTSWNDSYGIRMPIEASADGNAIQLHAWFTNQTIAAKTYYDLDNDILQDYLNPLPYTDEDGRLNNFELYFTEDVQFEDDGEYPLILNETPYLSNNHTTESVTEPIDLDSNGAFAYTYALSFVADDWIGIGEAYVKYNYLHYGTQSTGTIKIYTSTKPYGQFDQEPRSGDVDDTTNITYSYNSTTQTITITPTSDIEHFAIVRDNNILLWFNRFVGAGTTYNVYINNITTIVPVATREIEQSVTTDLTAEWSTKLTLTVDILEEVNTTISDYEQFEKITLAKTILHTVSPTISNYAQIESVDIGLDIFEEANTSVELTYIRSVGIAKNIQESVDTSLSISYLRNADLGVSILHSVNTSLSLVYDSTLTEVVQWQPVTSGTPDINQCLYATDEGNIKSELENECQFTEDGALYDRKDDQSTSIPPCIDGATYTVCFLNLAPDNLPFDTYVCQDYIGEIVQVTQLYKCERID